MLVECGHSRAPSPAGSWGEEEKGAAACRPAESGSCSGLCPVAPPTNKAEGSSLQSAGSLKGRDPMTL